MGKPIEEGKISQKDPARGKSAREIREGKIPIKEEEMAAKKGTKKDQEKY